MTSSANMSSLMLVDIAPLIIRNLGLNINAAAIFLYSLDCIVNS